MGHVHIFQTIASALVMTFLVGMHVTIDGGFCNGHDSQLSVA